VEVFDMAAPLAVAGLAIGAAGLLMNFIGSKKGAKAAKKEGAEEARLEGLVTDEKVRNLRTEQRSMYGETLAGYAGGGVLARAPSLESNLTLGDSFGGAGAYGGSDSVMTGSPSSVINEQALAFAGQRDITRKVGATKAQQSLTRGNNIADQYRYSGYANVASGISNILSTYAATK
jgi:hypothetical protein